MAAQRRLSRRYGKWRNGTVCCGIAEIRSVETILHGAPKTPFLDYGDRIRIEMQDAQGHSIFGAIEQEVIGLTNAAPP